MSKSTIGPSNNEQRYCKALQDIVDECGGEPGEELVAEALRAVREMKNANQKLKAFANAAIKFDEEVSEYLCRISRGTDRCEDINNAQNAFNEAYGALDYAHNS